MKKGWERVGASLRCLRYSGLTKTSTALPRLSSK
ncbi:branched-chain amino acid permease, partial [Neisseria meningitidis]